MLCEQQKIVLYLLLLLCHWLNVPVNQLLFNHWLLFPIVSGGWFIKNFKRGLPIWLNTVRHLALANKNTKQYSYYIGFICSRHRSEVVDQGIFRICFWLLQTPVMCIILSARITKSMFKHLTIGTFVEWESENWKKNKNPQSHRNNRV